MGEGGGCRAGWRGGGCYRSVLGKGEVAMEEEEEPGSHYSVILLKMKDSPGGGGRKESRWNVTREKCPLMVVSLKQPDVERRPG